MSPGGGGKSFYIPPSDSEAKIFSLFCPIFQVVPYLHTYLPIYTPCTYHTHRPSIFHRQTIYLPSTYNVPSTYLTSTCHLHNMYLPYTDHMPAIYIPYTYHLPTTYLP